MSTKTVLATRARGLVLAGLALVLNWGSGPVLGADLAALRNTTLRGLGGERVGLLCAGSYSQRAFGEEAAEIARAIANLAAVAIKRAAALRQHIEARCYGDPERPQPP